MATGIKLSELTNEEMDAYCISLGEVRITDVSRPSMPGQCRVTIDGNSEVDVVRVNDAEVEMWFEHQVGKVVEMKVFPYQWEVCGRSGTVYFFRSAEVKDVQ